MTTSTPNLGLVLYNSTTDSAEYFSNFRAVIAGTSLTSNFYKIDTAYGSMQTEIDDIQAGAYFTLASYISANYYEATVTGVTAYNVGMKIILSLDTASAGTVTLNINSLGIKSVMKIDSSGTPVNISSGELMVGKYYFFAYDGTRWVWVDSTSSDQIYIPGTNGNVVTVNSDNTLLGTTTQSSLISTTINSATEKTVPVDADVFSILNSASSYVLNKITWLSLRLAVLVGIKPQEGVIWNGVITVSVSSNNLIFSLKTFAGTDPSSTDPIYVTLNGAVRTITSSISKTISAGTNTFNAGSSELATRLINYFTYLGYNATDGVVIGISRIPNARKYSDFSATATNEKYCAISTITNATSTDVYVNIGRISATLSAGAGYTWSISGTGDVINRPIYNTDFLNWLPTLTNITVGNGTLTSVYSLDSEYCNHEIDFVLGSTSAVSAAVSITPPFTNANLGQAHPLGQSVFVDNGTGSFSGTYEANGSGSIMRIRALNSAGTYLSPAALSSTIPFTWVATDEISITGRYKY